MMKRILISALILVIGATAFAGDRYDPMTAEIESILEDKADTAFGDLTFGEVENLMGRLSVPMQEARYIRASSFASMMMPGKGQFMNGDALSGTLFFTADLLVTAGVLAGVYYLLPAELQFGQLDYLNTPHNDIKTAWQTAAESMTFLEALPTLGVVAGGVLLHHGLRAFSASHAARLAQENIEEGNLVFEPRTSFFTSGHGRLGIGMGMRF